MQKENNREKNNIDEISWNKILQERQEIKKMSKQLQKEVTVRKETILNNIDKRSDGNKESAKKITQQIDLAMQKGDKEKLKELLQNML